MKPHFGQSDAAMNKLAGHNRFPNAGKGMGQIAELEAKAREAGFNTPLEYLRAQHESAAGMGLEPEFIERLMTKECQHEFTDIATCVHCGCDTDGFISSKRIEPKGQGGLIAEFTLRREPLTKGYFGHEDGCDCAVCENMHFRELYLKRKAADLEEVKRLAHQAGFDAAMGPDFDPVKERDATYDLGWKDCLDKLNAWLDTFEYENSVTTIHKIREQLVKP